MTPHELPRGSRVRWLLAAACLLGAAPRLAADGGWTGMRTSVEALQPVSALADPVNLGVGMGMDFLQAGGLLPFLATDLSFGCALFPVAPGTLADLGMGELLFSMRAGLGLQARIDLGPSLRVTLGGSVGGALDTRAFDSLAGLTWYWAGTAGVGWKLSEAMAFTLDAAYATYDAFAGLVTVSLGLETSWPTAAARSPAAAGSKPSSAAGGVRPVKPGPVRGGSRPCPLDDRTALPILATEQVVELTRKAKADPGSWLKQLSQALVKDGADDFQKVRALHDWVAVNIAYDADAFYGKSPTITSPLEVIRRGSSVCQGYAEVFQLMSRYAGYECAVVSGYARGVGFDPMQDLSGPFQSNHAWNAVRIGDRWYLVDCTWDAGYMNVAERKSVQRYGTSFLFSDPRGFLCSHYPGQPEWQLVDRPVGWEDFLALPHLEPSFFQAGLSLDPGLLLVNKAQDRFSFFVEAPDHADVTAFVDGGGADGVLQPAYRTREEGRVRFQAAFPGPGTYRIEICVGTDGPTPGSRSYSSVGEFSVTAAQGTPLLFPSAGYGRTPPDVTFQGALPYDPRVESEISLPFAVAPGTRLRAAVSLSSGSTRSGIEQRAIVLGQAGPRVVRATFPGPGDYIVDVYTVSGQGETQRWDTAASFPVHVSKGTDAVYPLLYNVYFEEGWEIISPLGGPLRKGSVVQVELAPPSDASLADAEVQAETDGHWFKLARGADGRYRGTVTAAGNGLSVNVKRGSAYHGILRWDVK
jgi:transglutaminase-like putative cysteine protease